MRGRGGVARFPRAGPARRPEPGAARSWSRSWARSWGASRTRTDGGTCRCGGRADGRTDGQWRRVSAAGPCFVSVSPPAAPRSYFRFGFKQRRGGAAGSGAHGKVAGKGPRDPGSGAPAAGLAEASPACGNLSPLVKTLFGRKRNRMWRLVVLPLPW